MKEFNVYSCSIIELKKKYLLGSSMIGVESNKDVPFQVKRCYYLYDVPNNKKRGAHAHKNLIQLMIAVSGSFDVCLDDGENKKEFFLNTPSKGLLIVPGIWRDLKNFSSEAICLVLASELYDETDYIRNYDEFLQYRKMNAAH